MLPDSSREMTALRVLRSRDLGGDLVLGAQLAADLGAGQDILTVLVELELGDDNVGGVEAQRHALARGLVAGDALDVDDVFEAVDGDDLALAALVGAADNGDLVVLADGDAADLWGEGSQRLTTLANTIKGPGWVFFDVRCTSRAAPCSGERSC